MNMTATQQDFAIVFPGQGSQSVGMMNALAAEFDAVRMRFDSASGVLGFDLWELVANGPEEQLGRTEHTQPALLAASVATWDIWLALGGPRPRYLAGHSFGEYSALVCAGALDFETGIALVADRGRYMQEAVPAGQGAMAAILGLELAPLEAVCREASAAGGVCSCANLNAPGQIVIAGDTASVDTACALAGAAGAKRALRLPVSVPAHCALMQPAALRLAERLAGCQLTSPAIPVINNVDVAARNAPGDIADALVRQVCSPVRWIETIEFFAASGIRTVAECGPGKVLGALIKRIDRSLTVHSLGAGDDLRQLQSALQGGIS